MLIALILASCAPASVPTSMPTETVIKITTATPKVKYIPTYVLTATPTATYTPTATATPLPAVILLSPFANCNMPSVIRANGSYMGPIPPGGYDSAMAPGGNGNNVQGHSDFARNGKCTDNAIVAPVSGILSRYSLGVRILLDASKIEYAPGIDPMFIEALEKALAESPYLIMQLGHMSPTIPDGHVEAGQEIGNLAPNAANVPMLSYQLFLARTPTTAWDSFTYVWSPAMFAWEEGLQPVCGKHCEMKLNNYYSPP